MIISFDLDGVIADTDPAILNRLHAEETRMTPGAYYALMKYYSSRRVNLHPAEWLDVDDQALIITGRLPMAHAVTRRWVNHHLGDRWPIVFISGEHVAELFAAYDDYGAIAEIARCKLGAIATHNVGLHIDNNPEIVGYLRAAGIPTLLHGGSVWQPTDAPLDVHPPLEVPELFKSPISYPQRREPQ